MIQEQELSERKLKILQAIIKNYLETGEPVGSRTISKYTDLNLSSATIRNEMADLEELGYILQPHTSAGRIPSDKGYRLYVDMLMEQKEQELSEMQEQMLEKADKMDQLLKQAAKVLANSTNYATLVSSPMNNRNRIKFIQLTMVDEEQMIAVIVLDGNVIKNKIIHVDEPINNENLLKLNMLLNTTLNGMSIEEINLGLIARLKEPESTARLWGMYWMQSQMLFRSMKTCRSTQAVQQIFLNIRNSVISRVHRKLSVHSKKSSSLQISLRRPYPMKRTQAFRYISEMRLR